MDVPEILQAFAMDAYDHEDKDDASPQPAIPIITPTSPSTPSARPQLRKRSEDMSGKTSRPKLKRRARIAPHGTLFLWSPEKPQPRRGAISVCEERPKPRRRSRVRQSHLSPVAPRLSYISMSAAKSIIGQRMMERKIARKTGLKADGQVRRVARRATQCQIMSEAHGNGSKAPPSAPNSCSEIARERERRERDKLDPLRTLLFFDSDDDLSDTTESILATPMDLCGPPSPGSFIQTYTCSVLDENGRLTPESTFSDVALLSRRNKHHSLPLSAYDGWKTAFNRRSLATKAKVKGRWTVYEPGPIRLEENFTGAWQRRSIATRDDGHMIERFDEMEPIAKRSSDAVALDSIVCFFEELGIEADSSEDCLDRYWEPDERTSRGLMRRKAGAAAAAQAQGQAAVSPSTSLSHKTVALAWQTARQREGLIPPSPESPGRRGLRSLLKSHRTLV